MKNLLSLLALATLIFTGCKAPLAYTAAPPQLKAGGPTVAVLPVKDLRTNKELDAVIEEGYLADVQRAVADELKSMNQFSAVVAITNAAAATVDLSVLPTLRRLEWEVPNYNSLLLKTFVISLLTGGIGGGIYISTGTDVYGHAAMDFEIVSTGKPPLLLNGYAQTVSNHCAKASSDTPKRRAQMASTALQATLSDLKRDLDKQLAAPTAARQ